MREKEKAFHYSTCGGVGVKIVSAAAAEEHLRNGPHLRRNEVLHCDVGSGDSSADGASFNFIITGNSAPSDSDGTGS